MNLEGMSPKGKCLGGLGVAFRGAQDLRYRLPWHGIPGQGVSEAALSAAWLAIFLPETSCSFCSDELLSQWGNVHTVVAIFLGRVGRQ